MKCHNCNHHLRKLAHPRFYTQEIGASGGIMRVTWKQTHICPNVGCHFMAGVAVKCEPIEGKPPKRKNKPSTKEKEKV